MNIHFSSKTDEWETPQDFFDKLDKEFHFKFDVCATEENSKCGLSFFDREMDGLEVGWPNE